MTRDIDLRIEALLSIQRALWDMVTPALRGATISVQPGTIHSRFLFEHEPTTDELEIVVDAETEVIADFRSDVDVSFRGEALPPSTSRELLPGEEWVYLRRESSTPAAETGPD